MWLKGIELIYLSFHVTRKHLVLVLVAIIDYSYTSFSTMATKIYYPSRYVLNEHFLSASLITLGTISHFLL